VALLQPIDLQGIVVTSIGEHLEGRLPQVGHGLLNHRLKLPLVAHVRAPLFFYCAGIMLTLTLSACRIYHNPVRREKAIISTGC
jgi:hypothetical protein